MANHNQTPKRPEQETFAHQEFVQFEDEQLALGFRTEGDVLVLGHGSNHKYASSFDREFGSMAIITTESGNHYGLASGFVINRDEHCAYPMQDDDIRVTIGEPAHIPGVGGTTRVKSVLLRYKIGDWPGAVKVDKPNPFKVLEAQAQAAAEALYGTPSPN